MGAAAVIALQVVVLTVVMVVGVAVVLTLEPLHQALVLGLFGFALILLFVVLQAPDVGMSELVVSTTAIPLVLLAAIYQTRDTRDDED